MIFKIVTEKGSEIAIDTEQVPGPGGVEMVVDFEVGGERFEVAIKKIEK